jgi:hypothetical protein
MTALIVALIISQGYGQNVVVFLPAHVYASGLLCDSQVRDTANRVAARYPDAKARVACVPAVPGE